MGVRPGDSGAVFRGLRAQPPTVRLRGPIPCANGPGAITVDTTHWATDQPMTVHAEDAADNPAAPRPVTVRVDNTAPGAVPGSKEADTWRNRTTSTSLGPTRMRVIARRSRPATRFACVRWVRASTPSPARRIDHLSNLTVPSPGEWQLRVWREDAAGTMSLPTPPCRSPYATTRSRPTWGSRSPRHPIPHWFRSQLVTDKISGLATGQIELSARALGPGSPANHGRKATQMARDRRRCLPPGVRTYCVRRLGTTPRTRTAPTDGPERTPMTVTLPAPESDRSARVSRTRTGKHQDAGSAGR